MELDEKSELLYPQNSKSWIILEEYILVVLFKTSKTSEAYCKQFSTVSIGFWICIGKNGGINEGWNIKDISLTCWAHKSTSWD